VVALNNQPQGGLITRKGTTTVRRRDEGFFGWSGWGFQSNNTRRGGQSAPRQNSQNYYRSRGAW
jgi:hypothetical protein